MVVVSVDDIIFYETKDDLNPHNCRDILFWMDITNTERCKNCMYLERCKKDYTFQIEEIKGIGKPDVKVKQWFGLK
jgi:hypothetical protein